MKNISNQKTANGLVAYLRAERADRHKKYERKRGAQKVEHKVDDIVIVGQLGVRLFHVGRQHDKQREH